MNRILIAALLSLALSSAARAQVPAGGLTNIGIAAAVRGAVNALAPGQAAGRVIGSGKPVYLNDRITTGPDSRLQILLLDETTFTLGPNSDMVLDEFVYDPKTSAGKVSARISSGAFRFITGKVAQKNPANMKVTLPVGTIGIRGTMVAGRAHGRDAQIVLVGPGPDNNAQERRGGISVFNEHGRSDVNASGYGVAIVDGGRPSRGFRFSSTQLAEILDELEPRHTAGKGGPSDASRNSGDMLAHGGINFHAFQNLSVVAQILNQTTALASQQAAASPCSGGTDCWSDLLAIQSGVAGYQGSGTFSCSGSCPNIGSSGSFSYGINVDFGNRTIGGSPAGYGSSTFSIGGDNISVNAISYANFTGKATYTMTAADAPQGLYGTLTGTALTFLRVNGQNAAALQINLNYNYNNGSGPATGTATGTSTAPKGAPIPNS
jgi:hypothetical protein